MSTETVYRPALLVEKPPRKVSLQTFLRKYRKGGPGVKYEYNKGVIEKMEAMKAREQYLALNIQRQFTQTDAARRGGQIVQELEMWTSADQWRKPDLAFISIEQIRAAMQGYEPVPEFVIEIISPSDQANRIKNKVYEYFRAGVKVLWHIFPEQEVVEVYRSPEDLEVCSGRKTCSAEPVIQGMTLPAEGIFKKV